MHDNVQNGTPRRAPPSPRGDYYAHHEWGSAARLSTTVVHALADAMGRDATDTGFVLSDHVDPDALDRLFERGPNGRPGSSGHVAFTVDGYRVTVYSSGQIVITPPAPAR